jgi:hypothetical protein
MVTSALLARGGQLARNLCQPQKRIASAEHSYLKTCVRETSTQLLRLVFAKGKLLVVSRARDGLGIRADEQRSAGAYHAKTFRQRHCVSSVEREMLENVERYYQVDTLVTQRQLQRGCARDREEDSARSLQAIGRNVETDSSPAGMLTKKPGHCLSRATSCIEQHARIRNS